MRKFPILLPPNTEQLAIASFLDRETCRIDTLIAKKHELVERLKEKRAALISRAVTSGLNPSVPLKLSDVAWLGHVPKHWVTKKVTYGFSRIGSGTTPKSDNDEYYEGGVPWVTTSELRETLITKTKQTVSKSAIADYSALRLYPPATLLFAMYGATIGRLGILEISATLNQACCAFAEPTLFDTRFVFYWLWMRRPILISLSSGGGQPNLSQDDLRQIRIPTPPLPEQVAIAAYLDKETAKLDELVANVEEAVERLLEYRTALITAAVTGKIDVRPLTDYLLRKRETSA
jgi:type I restriction enzyme S subunit